MEPDTLVPERAIAVKDRVHRQCVKELIGENDTGEALRQRPGIEIDGDVIPFGEGLRHLAAAGAEFDDGEVGRRTDRVVEIADPRRDQNSEDRLDLLGGEEVAGFAEGIAARSGGAAVVAVFRMVERHLHEAAECHRPSVANLRRQQFAGGRHGRASRLCGV